VSRRKSLKPFRTTDRIWRPRSRCRLFCPETAPPSGRPPGRVPSTPDAKPRGPNVASVSRIPAG